MTPDAELLRRYAQARSEEAFGEIVRRYVDLVYSAALRQVNGDAPLAEDVAQTVFASLARQAESIAGVKALAGWLYNATNFAAAKAVRSESRRRRREQDVCVMNELLNTPAPELDWGQLGPVLDEVMQKLRPRDRDLILMRYFEGRRLANMAEMLGLTEDTARKRVERALEKLRASLAKRGLSTAASLASVLSAHAVSPAPAELAATLTGASLSMAHLGATSTALSAWPKVAVTKGQAAIVAGICLAAVVPLFFQQRTLARARRQNLALRAESEQLAERVSEVRAAVRPGPASVLSRAQFSRLIKLRGEAGVQRDELTKLRAELAVSQASAEARAYAVSNYFPRASWADAGYATPAAAIQSYNWVIGQALLRHDTNTLASLFPGGWAGMNQESGGDAAKIAAELSQEAASFSNTDGIRLVDERPAANGEVDVKFMLFTNHGTNDGWGAMTLKPVGGQWQLAEPLSTPPAP